MRLRKMKCKSQCLFALKSFTIVGCLSVLLVPLPLPLVPQLFIPGCQVHYFFTKCAMSTFTPESASFFGHRTPLVLLHAERGCVCCLHPCILPSFTANFCHAAANCLLKSLVSPCITSAMVPMRCLARF